MIAKQSLLLSEFVCIRMHKLQLIPSEVTLKLITNAKCESKCYEIIKWLNNGNNEIGAYAFWPCKYFITVPI